MRVRALVRPAGAPMCPVESAASSVGELARTQGRYTSSTDVSMPSARSTSVVATTRGSRPAGRRTSRASKRPPGRPVRRKHAGEPGEPRRPALGAGRRRGSVGGVPGDPLDPAPGPGRGPPRHAAHPREHRGAPMEAREPAAVRSPASTRRDQPGGRWSLGAEEPRRAASELLGRHAEDHQAPPFHLSRAA